MESGVDFIAVDNPHANRLMLHMLAAFGEHEREQISLRTKAALQAAKTRGIRLGRNGAERLAPANRAAAMQRARALAPLLVELRDGGLSARRIARELAARGVPTPSAGSWHPQSVTRMLNRIDARGGVDPPEGHGLKRRGRTMARATRPPMELVNSSEPDSNRK